MSLGNLMGFISKMDIKSSCHYFSIYSHQIHAFIISHVISSIAFSPVPLLLFLRPSKIHLLKHKTGTIMLHLQHLNLFLFDLE